MDPIAALAAARQAIQDTDITTARDHLTDITNWINIGGFVPDGYYTVLDEYSDLERELSALLH